MDAETVRIVTVAFFTALPPTIMAWAALVRAKKAVANATEAVVNATASMEENTTIARHTAATVTNTAERVEEINKNTNGRLTELRRQLEVADRRNKELQRKIDLLLSEREAQDYGTE